MIVNTFILATKEARNLKQQAKNSNFAKVIEDLKNSRFNTSSKNLQTYARANKNNNSLQESPAKDFLEINKRNLKAGKETVKNITNFSYDYLAGKVNKGVDKMDFSIDNSNLKSMDVRYLCDMTKCIRERIKQIVEDSNNVCNIIKKNFF